MKTSKLEEGSKMPMQEASQVIWGLRAAGWDEKKISDFILWIESGDPRCKPEPVDVGK